jgi:hypothetical protein
MPRAPIEVPIMKINTPNQPIFQQNSPNTIEMMNAGITKTSLRRRRMNFSPGSMS